MQPDACQASNLLPVASLSVRVMRDPEISSNTAGLGIHRSHRFSKTTNPLQINCNFALRVNTRLVALTSSSALLLNWLTAADHVGHRGALSCFGPQALPHVGVGSHLFSHCPHLPDGHLPPLSC